MILPFASGCTPKKRHVLQLCAASFVLVFIVFLYVVIKIKHLSARRAALQPVVLRVVLVIELIRDLAAALRACHVVYLRGNELARTRMFWCLNFVQSFPRIGLQPA
jgi:hypothetical protein